jgi:orotate phosphoribosyltransferase/AMMECR1 domain-containing protein
VAQRFNPMLRAALSSTLATLPEEFQSARSELITLLRRDAILHRSPTQPVLSRDGSSARWMLDSLAVTLSPRGAELAGHCLLELLQRFDGRQIATYGLTAVPLLQTCILQSGGRYRGLLVRKERKEHGSLKLIEGQVDPDEPVVLIDDSVSSGTSMEQACERLEQAGLRVEGGICLVRFGWHGGYARMQERGYHMEAVYDIWDDFIYHMEDEDKPLLNPSKWFPKFEWSPHQAPEGLHPARLARIVISEYLSTGKLLRAPTRLDKDYDSAGGTWVSLRSLKEIHLRHARDGFWHFPGENYQSAAEDVVLASLRTATDLAQGEAGLKIVAESGIAVTFFTALERCNVGDLDNDRYGIVVRSLERPATMGGALPRMPGIGNEWQQFQHARIKNGRLISFEPYEILRHDVFKAIEPDVNWQPTGVPAGDRLPWQQDQNICGRVAVRARDIVLARLFGQAETTSQLPSDLIAEPLDSVYVTVYINGQLRGCMGSATHQLDEDLRNLAAAALEDGRFEEPVPNEPASIAVTVSLLFNPLELGELLPEEVVPYYRHGQQTLMVYRGNRLGLLLPFVAATHNLDVSEFPQSVVEKSGLTEPPYYWCRFDCATWLADAGGTAPIVGGFRSKKNEPSASAELLNYYASLQARYLVTHQQADGNLYSSYEPFQNRLYEGIDLPRLAHGAWVLARAARVLGGDDLKRAAGSAINRVLKTARASEESEAGLRLETGDVGAQASLPALLAQVPSISEVSFLLLALSNLANGDPRRVMIDNLSATLVRMAALPHGRIATHRDPTASTDAFQDYFPGQALLALATAAEHSSATIDQDQLHRSFLYYRHRFRYQRHFGQVAWLMQAFSKWWQVTHEAQFAEFVFEVGDWLLQYQQAKTGAFINDHQSDTPGYTTAVYLEGIGAAVHLAASLDNQERHRKYSESFLQGFGFLDQLIIQPRDESLLPNPEQALGGLRQGLYFSVVRTDFVQHSLAAILGFLAD